MDDKYIRENYYEIVKYYLLAKGVSEKEIKRELEIYDDGQGPYIPKWSFPVEKPRIQDIRAIDTQAIEKRKKRQQTRRLVIPVYNEIPDDPEEGEIFIHNREIYINMTNPLGSGFKKVKLEQV